MKNLFRSYMIICVLLSTLLSCKEEEEAPQPDEMGYLSMNISISVTSEEASGRLEAVNTDDFRVTIFDAAGTEVAVFDPFSDAPTEVALPTGVYYVEAHSNNLVDAAFENPYYFGRSANFTIDKEETTTIDITPELANTKVAIIYSDNVINTFDSYTGTVTVTSTGANLFFAQGETREGYFISGTLDAEVNLSYNKLDGSTIDRTFSVTIPNALPKTLYNINVDAELADGSILFNIVVDDSFSTIEIDLGEADFPPTGTFVDARDGQEYGYVTIGHQVWMSENLNFDAPDSRAYNDDLNLAAIYGRLYHWPTFMNGQSASDANPSGVQGICPDGWHVPSDSEWQEMEYFLGLPSSEYEEQGSSRGVSVNLAEKLKATSPLWPAPNDETNESGFSALPAGAFGTQYFNIQYSTLYWTSTSLYGSSAVGRAMGPDAGVVRTPSYSANMQYNAMSCRCIKD